jgi:hypothetical protein
MNDDELAGALRQAMTERTAGDTCPPALVQALTRTRVRRQHPYLVPAGAAAVVTALTTGGLVLSQTVGPTSGVAGADPTTSVAPPSAAASPSPAPVPAPASASGAPPMSPGATVQEARTTTVTMPNAAPTDGTDDAALLADAASYSVSAMVVPDAARPAIGSHPHTETFLHDGTTTFSAGTDRLDWDQLAALPADTAAFAAKVKAPGQLRNPVEKGLQALVLEGPMPLQVRKNVVAVAETAPGATVTQNAHDDFGRPAIKISIETDLLVDDYYFDPVTYRLLKAGETFTQQWKAANPSAGDPKDFYTMYTQWTIVPKAK